MVTDMPGYYIAPGLFALTNVIVVPIMALALASQHKHEDRSDHHGPRA